jgi:hypothetical protein
MTEIKTTLNRDISYWIQSQAPAGNYYDVLGSYTRNEAEAVTMFNAFVQAEIQGNHRLVRREDTVIAGPTPAEVKAV